MKTLREKIKKIIESVKAAWSRLMQNKVAAAIVAWMGRNRLFLLYLVFATLIELSVVLAIEGKPWMSRPFLAFGVLLLIASIVLLIKNDRARLVIYTVLLGVQGALGMIFTVIYELTGQYFDFGMLNLRNDAMATLESMPINFLAFFGSIFFSAFFLIFGMRSMHVVRGKESNRSLWFKITSIVTGAAIAVSSFFVYYPIKDGDKYEDMINGSAASAYSAYGVIGNLVGEFASAAFKDDTTVSEQEIEKFIYDETKTSVPTEYFGISKDKNVVTVLGETFEWFAFMQTAKHKKVLGLTDAEFAELFPTLTWFYQNSVSMTNFHSREKTDISETLSIMGSYPTDAYINYDYYENTMPTTLPNILRQTDGENISIRSFHNGFKSFYNREQVHKVFGFESLSDSYDLEKMVSADGDTFVNWYNEGNRNLDAEMIRVADELMFPTDKRFYTYITTITMHGVFTERENLQDHQAVLTAMMERVEGRMPDLDEDEGIDADEKLRKVLFYYTVAALEFEEAMTDLKRELCQRPDGRTADPTDTLWDNTVVVIFGDHNAYYHKLSEYVKDIDDYETKNNYTDLFNVPLMIYDGDLTAKLRAQNPQNANAPITIDKFTCTADISPTLLDLLGIRYYTNMYYGRSVFNTETSVLYSRAYDNFIADGIVAKSVKTRLYTREDITQAQIQTYENRAIELVEKIRYCDYIFKQDYFGKTANMQKYKEKLSALNGWN